MGANRRLSVPAHYIVLPQVAPDFGSGSVATGYCGESVNSVNQFLQVWRENGGVENPEKAAHAGSRKEFLHVNGLDRCSKPTRPLASFR